MMNKRHCALLVSLAVVAGLLGGALSARVFSARSALAETPHKAPGILSAEAFQIVDKDGKVCAVLGQKGLVLLDKDGAIRFSLDTDVYGDAHMSLRDKAGTIRLMLGLDLGGKPYVGLADEDGEADVKLEVGERGSFLFLCGKNPASGAALGADQQGNHLSLSDKDGQSRLWLTVDSKGAPSLNLYDKSGKLRAVVGSTALKNVGAGTKENTPPSSVVLFDGNEKVTWAAP